jgi:hypothetical protein
MTDLFMGKNGRGLLVLTLVSLALLLAVAACRTTSSTSDNTNRSYEARYADSTLSCELSGVESVTAEALHVRSAPSAQARKVDGLVYGERVDLLQRRGNWIQVNTHRYEGGWVYGAYLTGFDIPVPKKGAGAQEIDQNKEQNKNPEKKPEKDTENGQYL